jgi:hypothetical protein
MLAGANGNIVVTDSSQTDFDLFQLGGTSNSYPAIARTGDALAARLADNSDFTTVEGADPTTDQHYVTKLYAETNYQLLAERGETGGYAALDANALVPTGNLGSGPSSDGYLTVNRTWVDPVPLTTKGDLFTYSTADTRLAAGSDYAALTALSSETTGLAWSSGVPIVLSRTAANTTISDTTTETALLSHTIPANAGGENRMFRVTAAGQYINNSGTNKNFTFRVKAGTTVFYADQTNDFTTSANAYPWTLVFWVLQQSSSVQYIYGDFRLGTNSAPDTGLGDITDAAPTIDLSFGQGAAGSEDFQTTSTTIEATVEHSAASASTTFISRYSVLEMV